MSERSLEHCFKCNDLTGRAGKADDSLYCYGCDTGPYCPECWELHHAADKENASLKRKNEGLRQWLLVVLDCADYTAGNCRVNEMVGAVLPKEVIEQAREALLADTQEQDELEEALCFECTESIARCECPDGFYTGVDDGQTNVTV